MKTLNKLNKLLDSANKARNIDRLADLANQAEDLIMAKDWKESERDIHRACVEISAEICEMWCERSAELGR